MPTYRTQITVLQQIATEHPDSPAFQVPQYDPSTRQILQWHPVTFSRFLADVELYARYWSAQLTANGVLPRSVVGMW